ncbi:MAG: sec-independent protein translocase protein TatA [Candidatus Azotimanducaceae bacterium]|jgi:sec-independent protein translocase protein TatA
MERNMFGLGMTELLVILAIVLLIFGPKRLKNIGADLGNAIKGFRTAVTEEEKAAVDPEAQRETKIIEGEATTASSEKASEENKV